MGICFNESGNCIYAIDYSGYLLKIINTSSSKSSPIFNYTYFYTGITPPKSSIFFIPNTANSYGITGNYIQCKTNDNGEDFVLFAYPSYSDEKFMSPYSYYLFNNNIITLLNIPSTDSIAICNIFKL